MADSLAAVRPRPVAGLVLAAGAGTRLRPLTRLRPKPLCPVGGVALVDLALARVAASTGWSGEDLAVNVHHGRAQMEAHLAGAAPGVHVSVEEEQALGTAGAVGRLRSWLDGRGVVVVNGDTWTSAAVAPLLEAWDGERVGVLVAGPSTFGPQSRLLATVLPGDVAASIEATPSGLYEVCLREAHGTGRLLVVGTEAPAIDCGTPADYLAANLMSSGGESVIDPAVDLGGGDPARIVRSVVWSGATVAPAERLVDAIRADRLTILVR